MPRKFKEARQINKLKVIEAAAKLGVSQPTLSAWEGERKSPGLDHLENMADLYGVSTDYLLGRSKPGAGDPNVPIPIKALPVFHGKPVWSAQYGWLLVNAIDKILLSPDSELRNELRGWYWVQARFVQNEYGNRFYPDTYGAKWLAFDKEE